jgi:NAD(P)-dependent dehydrogenase (short-subunit alcohol dehydrogenase family)
MGQFSNRVVLVTGGNSGIGRATALAFAREGATVVIAARRVAQSEATVQAITAEGGKATFLQADVTKEAEVQHLVEHIVAAQGHLDVAFNNASMVSGMGPLTMQTEAVWDEAIASVLKSVFLCLNGSLRLSPPCQWVGSNPLRKLPAPSYFWPRMLPQASPVPCSQSMGPTRRSKAENTQAEDDAQRGVVLSLVKASKHT